MQCSLIVLYHSDHLPTGRDEYRLKCEEMEKEILDLAGKVRKHIIDKKTGLFHTVCPYFSARNIMKVLTKS